MDLWGIAQAVPLSQAPYSHQYLMFPSESSSASSAEDIQNSELNKVATVASTMRSHHLLRVWSYVPDVAPIFYPDNVRR